MDIDKMLEKLDELYELKRNPNMSLGVMTRELREILLAGKSEQPKDLNPGGYQTLALRIEEMQKKIMFLEQDRGHRLKEIEKRVQLINEWIMEKAAKC